MSSAGPATEIPREEPTPQVDEITAEVVETDAFNAIPEHSGKLRDLIERHTNGEGECPYIQSMGVAGVELVERLAESEANPERGMTMREMMEAQEKEEAAAEIFAKSADGNTKSSVLSLESALSSITGTNSETSTTNLLEDQVLMNHVRAEEHGRRSDEQVSSSVDLVESADSQTVEPTVIASETPRLAPTAESAPVAVAPKLEEISKPLDILTPTVVIEMSKETTTDDLPQPDSAKIEKPRPAESVPIEVPNISKEAVTTQVLATEPAEPRHEINNDTPAVAVITEHLREDTEESELGDLISKITKAFADTFEDSEDDDSLMPASETDSDSDELATELYLSETEKQPGNTEVDASQPEQEPAIANINQELTAYIEALEPDKVETVTEALQAFIEAVSGDQELTDDSEPQKRLVRLLESIGLDYQDEKTKKLAEAILEPLIRARATSETGLTIDQLNNMGTREYKVSSISDVITNLRQFIKQQTNTHLRLGRYATSFSFAS